MASPTWSTFYAMLQQMQQQGLPPPLPPGANDWVNNIQPDGSLAGAQVTPTPPGYGTPGQPHTLAPKPPGPAQQVAGMAGQVGGMAAGGAAANAVTGGSAVAPFAPPLVPSAGVSSGVGVGAGSGYPATEALLAGGSQEGIAGGMSAAATPTTWWSTVAPYMFGAAAIGLGGYTAMKGKEAFDNAHYSSGNPITGLKEGIEAAGPLNFVPVLGQLPWVAGAAGAMFGSGKDKAQHARDMVRSELVKTGFLNPDYTFALPDGTAFDWGKDGNARLPSEGKDPLTGQDWRHYYDIDWSKSDAGGLVAAANPLAALFARGDKKLTSDFAGYIVNTARQSSDPLAAIKAMIEKAGMKHEHIYGAIHLLSKSQGGPLDDSLADSYKNGLDQMYGVGAYKGQGSKLGTPDIQPGQKPQKPQMQQAPKPQQVDPDDDDSPPMPSPQAPTPPQGAAGQAQQKPQPKPSGSPFVGSRNFGGGAHGLIGRRYRT